MSGGYGPDEIREMIIEADGRGMYRPATYQKLVHLPSADAAVLGAVVYRVEMACLEFSGMDDGFDIASYWDQESSGRHRFCDRVAFALTGNDKFGYEVKDAIDGALVVRRFVASGGADIGLIVSGFLAWYSQPITVRQLLDRNYGNGRQGFPGLRESAPSPQRLIDSQSSDV